MSFSQQLKDASRKIIADTDEFRQAITIELFSSVIFDTPVDTGRARGNWQTSQNTPAQSSVGRLDTSGSEAQAEAIGVVSASPSEGSIYLTNNLPYALKLEYGHSKQAPAGMVRKNMARIEQIVRSQQSKT